MEALKEAGVDAAFNIYGEAGAGFAEHVCREVDRTCEIIKRDSREAIFNFILFVESSSVPRSFTTAEHFLPYN